MLYQDAKDLEMKYTEVSQKLEVKVNETKIARERADNLKERASVMYQNIYSKFQTLQGILKNWLHYLPLPSKMHYFVWRIVIYEYRFGCHYFFF